MLESFFNKAGVLRACNFIIQDSDTGAFCESFKLFKNTYFLEDLETTSSEKLIRGSFFNKVASLTT